MKKYQDNLSFQLLSLACSPILQHPPSPSFLPPYSLLLHLPPYRQTDIQTSILVLPSRLLTRLKLIHIPPTDTKAPLVLIHAPTEARHVLRTGTGLRLLARRVDLVRLLELGGRGGRLGGRAAAAAREPAADCVADRGADCDTAVMFC
jgi:hypothetical protein